MNLTRYPIGGIQELFQVTYKTQCYVPPVWALPKRTNKTKQNKKTKPGGKKSVIVPGSINNGDSEAAVRTVWGKANG